MFKSEKGITLVALVITIIVLLILAGVTMMLALGNNGILGQASNAKLKQMEGEADEQMKMALSSTYMAILSYRIDHPGQNMSESEVIAALQAELPASNGYTVALSSGTGSITYDAQAYITAGGTAIVRNFTYSNGTLTDLGVASQSTNTNTNTENTTPTT